jgi:predicted ABC-class ATPase
VDKNGSDSISKKPFLKRLLVVWTFLLKWSNVGLYNQSINMQNLENILTRVEGQGYKAYKRLQGEYKFAGFQFFIDHVQGDPFAEPSRCRVVLPIKSTSMPDHLYDNPGRRTALEDYFGRRFADSIDSNVKGGRGSGRGGEFEIASYGQQVLHRSNVTIDSRWLEVRFQIGLPANNRRIDAEQARIMLFEELPAVVESALIDLSAYLDTAEQHVNCIENQQYLRDQLESKHLIAFIADGSNLARKTGVDDHPLDDAIKIKAPDSISVQLPLKHGAVVAGVAFPKGINLIVGGGFHGKSTLLRAIEQGIYDHIPGDGRELVVSDPTAFKLQAEDGRAISGVDIRPFIQNLPGGKDCGFFSTANASGSSSQAASIIEALSSGVQTLLIDEDTSASNFLIRDRCMQLLVPKDKEPITPLSQRIRQLYDQYAISVVMVMGGSGDYFSLADQVVMMDNYQPVDATQRAHELARPGIAAESEIDRIVQHSGRIPIKNCLSVLGPSGKPKIKAFGTRLLQFGEEDIPLQALEQLVDTAQLLSIGYLIEKYGQDETVLDGDIVDGLGVIYERLKQNDFDSITPYPMGKLALPRLQELIAVINRMRMLKLKQG